MATRLLSPRAARCEPPLAPQHPPSPCACRAGVRRAPRRAAAATRPATLSDGCAAAVTRARAPHAPPHRRAARCNAAPAASATAPPATPPPAPGAAVLAAAVAAAPPPAQAAPVFIAPGVARPYEEWLSPDMLSCCEPGAAPLRVAVLLSGGVDSSVALNLVAAAGHKVTAFYLQIWFQEDFRNYWEACPWEEDLAYARAVCDQARVPLKVVPLTKQYWERVVAHSLAEIAAGRTPNPDVLCNSRIKFGAFLEHVAAAHAGAFDRVASGHYARVTRFDRAGGGAEANADAAAAPAPLLRLSEDAAKDQTYFLAGLSPTQLRSAMFPLGGLPKPAVRALAAAGRLPTAARKDSQGICFLGKVKFSEFVAEHLGDRPGPLVELESNKQVGTHRGFWFHTIGQRQGLGLPGGPWYVAAKDAGRNVVFVSRAYHDPDKRRNAFRAGAFSWLGHARPPQGAAAGVRVKVRHGATLYPCALHWETPAQASAAEAAAAAASAAFTEPIALLKPPPQLLPAAPPADADAPPRPPPPPPAPPPAAGLTARVVLDGNDQGLAAGQYAVFYDAAGACFGCGVILEALPGGADFEAAQGA